MTITIVVFVVVYLGMMMGTLPGLRVDRAAIALLGAIVLLASGQVTEQEALDSINFSTILLLFGLMIVSANFNLAGLYTAIAHSIRSLAIGPVAFLAIVVSISGVMSAFLTNDVIAVSLTPVLLGLCIARKLNPVPFLLALAFSANAGSIATIIGSPQNMLIGQHFNLSFLEFMGYTALPAVLSLFVVWAILAFQYRGSWDLRADLKVRPLHDHELDVWGASKGGVVIVILIGLFLATDWPRDIIALAAGGILLANATFKSRSFLERVDWQLLILFMGLFIVNGALQKTGLPAQWITDLQRFGVGLEDPVWIFVITAVLSDIVSNVPSVMLLLPFAKAAVSAPVMAIASGLSSNLIIIGSLASIIVVDAAEQRGLSITFWGFTRSGVPVTLITLGLSALWLWWWM